jgi:hypothetical protein
MNIEMPLTDIRNLLNAIALITEAMEEPHAGAVNVIVHAALEHVREIEGGLQRRKPSEIGGAA